MLMNSIKKAQRCAFFIARTKVINYADVFNVMQKQKKHFGQLVNPRVFSQRKVATLHTISIFQSVSLGLLNV